jgi:hypothetical protein
LLSWSAFISLSFSWSLFSMSMVYYVFIHNFI